MSIILRNLLPAFGAILLYACASNPPYTFSKDEKTASLKFLSTGSVSMCKGGNLYSLAVPEGSQAAPIPVGSRVSLGSFMYFSGYNVSYSCRPFLSFLPKKGETYVLHSFIRQNKCFIELVREDQTKETGVAFEPSVGRRDCFVKR